MLPEYLHLTNAIGCVKIALFSDISYEVEMSPRKLESNLSNKKIMRSKIGTHYLFVYSNDLRRNTN